MEPAVEVHLATLREPAYRTRPVKASSLRAERTWFRKLNFVVAATASASLVVILFSLSIWVAVAQTDFALQRSAMNGVQVGINRSLPELRTPKQIRLNPALLSHLQAAAAGGSQIQLNLKSPIMPDGSFSIDASEIEAALLNLPKRMPMPSRSTDSDRSRCDAI
jgi:hypothetical protein